MHISNPKEELHLLEHIDLQLNLLLFILKFDTHITRPAIHKDVLR